MIEIPHIDWQALQNGFTALLVAATIIQALADRIVEHWPGTKTIIMPCNGLDSYYAEMHGLIIGYGMGVASGK